MFINIETDPCLYSPPLILVLASPTPFRTSVAIHVTSPARVRTARNKGTMTKGQGTTTKGKGTMMKQRR